MPILDKYTIQAMKDWGSSVGDYWENSNKEFEKKDPTILDHALRGFNPITGFGSAIGDVSQYSKEGNIPMALLAAGMAALPARGFVKPFKGFLDKEISLVPDIVKTLKNIGQNVGSGAVVDEAQTHSDEIKKLLNLAK